MTKNPGRQLRFLHTASCSLPLGTIAVDLFAGGGGWSEGFQRATGVPPAVAVNHDADAIAMHKANHPESEHYEEDVFGVDPQHAVKGRRVFWLHLSPDCTHHSRAKGGKPLENKIRGLAWVGKKWAAKTLPDVLSAENVVEFLQWCPLVAKRCRQSSLCTPCREAATGRACGRVIKRDKTTAAPGERVPVQEQQLVPDARRKGQTFRQWKRALEALGYIVEWKALTACDFGAPTSRTRLFIVARRDGQPIVWPEPTHGPKRARPHRTAAECIDWSIPTRSIFDRKRPLAAATQRRIAEGIRRYVLNNPRPFIVNLTHGGRLESVDEPMKTVTSAHRGEKALVTPFVTGIDHQSGGASVWPLGKPLTTVTRENRHAMIAPTLIQTSYGERKGQAPRCLDIEKPLGTVVAGGGKHALVATWLAKHFGGVVGQKVDQPLGTVTAKDHHSVVAAHITKFYGTSKAGAPVDEPMPTATAGAGGGHAGLVAAFLAKWYGNDKHGQGLDEPLHTVPTKDRFALVTITIDGTEYVMEDIGLRMFVPRELARAQGFPDSYILTGTATSQTARIGNSVPPVFPEAIVKANLPAQERRAA